MTTILQPQAPPNVTSTGTSTTTLPGAITGFEGNTAGNATQLQNTPYVPYQGQMVAGPNANSTGAYQTAGGLNAAWGAPASQAGNIAAAMPGVTGAQSDLANTYGGLGVSAAYDPSNSWSSQANNWMNPYTSNVVNQIAQAGNQNWQTQMMPGINSQFISSGDMNSLNNMNGLGQGAGLAQQGITSAQANALQSGYTSGMQGYLSQLQSQVGAANNAANAANTTGYMGNYGLNAAAGTLGNLGTTGINNALGTGQYMTGLGQTGINAAMGQFNTAQNWSPQMLSTTSGAMSSLPWPGSVSGTSNAPLSGAGYQPSILGQVGSTLGNLSTLGNNIGGLGSTLTNGYNYLTGENSVPSGGLSTATNAANNVLDNAASAPSDVNNALTVLN